ncbi:aldehyde oxidoreductase molybdenum-binding subunit PaoC [Brevundimonas sp. PAMC22021]|uniref:aldehyde oxidoreductase molybdenum-binding subunit PaoC n=1 Tax=Brevundimonas sp. PAMC22021 TaxID=2861285 RepID=UPI001C62A5F7|nr:aldehyde oxidoreductase molybdenum-binding subunit PaoC [Brevundimonas sp. PAMC22021]QYF86847.1 xanthine dehydrogenase family protein molybdopterin-binding subunit [Brevundimonas sp. PAMC22021]
MKFEQPAGANPIDQMKVVGRPHDRIDGPLKTTGRALYAYEHRQGVENAAYGYVVGSAIAKGRIRSIDAAAALASPGVLGVVTAETAGELGKGQYNTARLLAGPEVQHYHQAVAVVVAETFEQARAAAASLKVGYARAQGRFSLENQRASAKEPDGGNEDKTSGDFDTAFAGAPVTLDEEYHTPDQSHAMMEPHASIARWNGDELFVWTSNQMIDWGRSDLAATLKMPKEKVRISSPYVGGGFGGKLFLRADALLAALAAREVRRPVKVALPRPFMGNNTTHRPATAQRIRIGAGRDGRITALSHESWSGDLPGGGPETATGQTQLLYGSPAIVTRLRLAELDLPEANAMRAPGEAPGLMALEIAMDEMAEKLGMDPVAFRVVNDTQVDPMKPERPFSQRQLVRCLEEGAERFGWSRRAAPGSTQDGRWLVGMGVAAAFRNNMNMKSAARVRLSSDGRVTVETDMTDIGTGSYTIIAQTAAEMLGVDLDRVSVVLGDSSFPVSAGSGGQWGANSATSGVYAACVKLRRTAAERLGLNPDDVVFSGGRVRSGRRSTPLGQAARDGDLVVEDTMEWGDLAERYQQSTFGAHFVEAVVDRFTGQTHIRRMLAVCAAGRILNPKTARSQVIGAMTMGVGGALMEELAVDKRVGFFVNHDLASYEVPVHADIPHQEVVFLEEADDKVSPMKAKGVGELGLCGVGAAVANAIYNATGVRIREYPITLDKYLDRLPEVA